MSITLRMPLKRAAIPKLNEQRVGIDVQESTMRIVCVGRVGNQWNWLSRSEVNLVRDRRVLQRDAGSKGDHGGGAFESITPADNITPAQLPNAIAVSIPPTIDALARKAVLVLPMSTALIRTPASQDTGVIERELKEDLGGIVGRDDSMLACSWIPGSKEPNGAQPGRTEQACIYATSRQLCLSAAKAVQGQGYELPRVTPRPHILANAVSLSKHPDAYGILEWGAKYCTLVLRSRWDTAAFGGPGHTRQLQGFSLHPFLGSMSNSGKEKNEKGSSDEDFWSRERRRRGLLNCVRGLADEIIRTLQAVRFEVPQGITPRLLVCGEAASMAGACEHLKNAIGHSVVPWEWSGVGRPASHFASPSDSRFAVALGAACDGGI